MNTRGFPCRIAWRNYLYEIRLEINGQSGTVSLCAVCLQLTGAKLARVSDHAGTHCGNPPSTHQLTFQSNCEKATTLACGVVDNTARGVCHPVVVFGVTTEDTSDTRWISIYLIHLIGHGSGSGFKLKLAGRLECEQCSAFFERGTFHLLNASLVAYVNCDEVHLVKFRHAQKPAQQFVCSLPSDVRLDSTSNKLLVCVPIPKAISYGGPTGVICGVLCVFTVLRVPDDAGSTRDDPWGLTSPNKTNAVIVTALHDGSCQSQIVDGSQFVPDVYGNLITCTKVISVHKNTRKEFKDLGLKCERKLHTTILACTVTGQLLSFENGYLMKCLPIEGISMIDSAILSFENCNGQLYYLVQSTTAVVVVDAKSFEVKHTFATGGRLFVCDFANAGGDQMLLVSEEEEKSPPDEWRRFIITDYHACNIRSTQCEESTEEGRSDDCVQAVVHALQGRLNASINYVCGVEREFQNKVHLVEDVFSALERQNSGAEKVTTTQSGLMPLIGDDTSGSAGDFVSTQQPPNALTASNIWHKVYDDNWVIGFSLSNKSKRCLRSVRVTLIPHGNHAIESSTFFVTHRKNPTTPKLSCEDAIPMCKIPRLDDGDDRHTLTPCRLMESGGNADVLVSTQLPGFGSGGTHTVMVVVSCIECPRDAQLPRLNENSPQDGVVGQRVKHKADRMGRCTVVGSVSVTAQDVVSGRLQMEPGLSMDDNDVLVMDAVQTRFPLSFQSTHSMLFNVSSLLDGALQLRWLETAGCWMRLNSGLLHHARVQLLPRAQPKLLNVNVYVRDKAQLFLLVHTLYAALPDDVMILPRCNDGITNLTSSILNAITSEAQFVKDEARTLRRTSTTEMGPESAERAQTADLQLIALRKEFVLKQKQLHGRQNVRFDRDKLEQFGARLHKLERRTNSAIQSLYNRMHSASTS